MSLLRTHNTSVNGRPTILVQLRMIDKGDQPLDPSLAWQALLIAFKDHPHYQVVQAEFSPDKGTSISETTKS